MATKNDDGFDGWRNHPGRLSDPYLRSPWHVALPLWFLLRWPIGIGILLLAAYGAVQLAG